MLDLEQYKEYYKENKGLPYPQTTWNRNKIFTDRELDSKYKDYCNKIEKQELKKEEKIIDYKLQQFEPKEKRVSEYTENINKAMKERHDLSDSNPVEFLEFLSMIPTEHKLKIKENMWLCPKNTNGYYTFDSAHIIERSICPKLANDIDNLVLLPRYLHTCIDNYIDYYTGERMGEKEHTELWIKLVGQERWDRLQRKRRD